MNQVIALINENKVDLAIVFLVSLFVILMVMATKFLHINRSSRGAAGSAVQSMHLEATPRIGGLGILLSLFYILYILQTDDLNLFRNLLLSTIPLYIAGIADDLNFNISPSKRLLSVIASTTIMIWLSQYWITNINTPILQPLMAITGFAILFTIFSITGVADSFNVVDGLNGLSLSIVLIIALSLACIATTVDDEFVALMSLFVCASALGVFVFNFPVGKIFLGDAGAYLLGYTLAWLAILLVSRNETVSAWSILLCFLWPVMETVYSIFRRLTTKHGIALADNNHMHHLIFRFLLQTGYFATRIKVINPVSTLFLAFIIILIGFGSVMTAFNSTGAQFLILLFSLVYIVMHKILLKRFHL